MVARQNWEAVFAWLGLALIIDAIDGPLARKFRVAEALPRFSGENLDQAVDYLNYCIVPAFIIVQSGLFEWWPGFIAGAVVVITSLYHFADRGSKTEDGYFVGFPALWNVLCFYHFAFAWSAGIALMLGAGFALLTFIPVKWVHPLRVRRLRLLNFVVVGLWGAGAVATVFNGFPADLSAQVILAISTVYIVALGVFRTFGFGQLN